MRRGKAETTKTDFEARGVPGPLAFRCSPCYALWVKRPRRLTAGPSFLMDSWIIDDHALERWRQRIHPSGTEADIRDRVDKARTLSRSQRRRLRAYWERHGQGGIGRVLDPRAPSYLLATRSVVFVIWPPNIVKTVYMMPAA